MPEGERGDAAGLGARVVSHPPTGSIPPRNSTRWPCGCLPEDIEAGVFNGYCYNPDCESKGTHRRFMRGDLCAYCGGPFRKLRFDADFACGWERGNTTRMIAEAADLLRQARRPARRTVGYVNLDNALPGQISAFVRGEIPGDRFVTACMSADRST